ncbi:MAG TPA: cytidine deaminase [Stellaceae bacterium]|nr:cytidine deaminase [Stellaceae bacterium]
MSGIEALIRAAAAARDNAYAPYSRFKVGAAIRAADGRIFVGANVENASYPAGLCAEAAALAAMIAAGARRVAELAIVAESAAPVPPCGLCRQRLAEFAGPEAEVHLGTTAGLRQTVRLGELLPLAFGAAHLPP